MELNFKIIALLTGFLLDKILGDPVWLPHPIVWFGKTVAKSDILFNKGRYKIIKGAFVTLTLVLIVFLVFFLISYYSYKLNLYVGISIESILIFYGIAGTTLIREGKAVFQKLEESLDAGRKQVARIVGRDISQLNHNQVSAATLETMAENLSDGVVAPLFWYALAGIPGIMAYKMINTLDSMIGYKSDKHLYFGRFAAKLDDIVNFIPARITALFMIIASGSMRALRFVFKYGKAHSSPNAGYPEAALAGILDVRFGGTSVYFGKKIDKPIIGENIRPIIKKDFRKTIQINRIVEIVSVLILLILLFFNKIPLVYLTDF